MTVPAISGALAIACGAFGAHSLRGKVDERMLEVWQTAANYHLAHAVASLGVVATQRAAAAGAAKGAAALAGTGTALKLFTAGTALFSGSLYLMVLTGEKRLGAITPIGGLTLIAGWLALAL